MKAMRTTFLSETRFSWNASTILQILTLWYIICVTAGPDHFLRRSYWVADIHIQRTELIEKSPTLPAQSLRQHRILRFNIVCKLAWTWKHKNWLLLSPCHDHKVRSIPIMHVLKFTALSILGDTRALQDTASSSYKQLQLVFIWSFRLCLPANQMSQVSIAAQTLLHFCPTPSSNTTWRALL